LVVPACFAPPPLPPATAKLGVSRMEIVVIAQTKFRVEDDLIIDAVFRQ
jgi:hypothetical protein